MKKILIRVIVLLLVFTGAAGIFALTINDETKTRTEEMSQATLPLVYMVYRDVAMNPLHGYVKPMAVTAVRDTLTPISTERDVSIRVETFGEEVSDIYFEVFTADGKTSLENTKVTDIAYGKDSIDASFVLQNQLRMGQEYVLKIQLRCGERDIYYYTRVVQQDSLHTKEYLDFVMSFSDRSLNKEEADSLAIYLEPESDVQEVNLSYMDIHTTTDQLAWGKLNPQIYYKSIPMIKELNETTATIVQEYLISAQNEKEQIELYTVNEYFRLRYADETVMLLDFERSTNEIFNPDNDVITETGVNLGICSRDISYVTDANQQYFAFVLGGELWNYNVSSGKMAQVFTFRQKGNSDYRDIYGQHEIKVLNLSTNGNMFFVVAGYMNRGRHEGESGVAVYYYDASSGGIEELLFVDTSRSYDLLKADVKELSYVTDDQETFFLLIDGDVYEINLMTLEVNKLVENLKPDCYAGSRSGRYFCYLEENEAYNSRTIHVYDLNTKEVNRITCGENERIRMIGYLEDALVYGIAEEQDIDSSHEGNELFPMKTLFIMDEQGEIVKEYGEVGIYVTDAEISNQLLTLTRMRKSGDSWEETTKDHIIDNSGENAAIGLTTQMSERKQTEMVLLVGEDFAGKTPQAVRGKMVVQPEHKEVTIPEKEHTEELYYVYAKGHLDGIYENANTAIVRADSQFGVVVNQEQQYIWERGNRKDISEISIDQVDQSILSGSMDIVALREQLPDKWVFDLTGCSTEAVLYFISEGNPVIANTTEGVRILLGYDNWANIRFYEPGAEESYLLADTDWEKLFEESGYVFIGFLNKPQQ